LVRVIALDRGKGKSKGTGLSLDGRIIPIDPAIALREGLKAGQELPADRVAALLKASNDEKCFNAALRYLSYRPLSESEMRQKLARRGFDEESVGATIVRLRERGLMDDADFARFWKENRQSFSPRSRWLIGQELKQKGVPQEAIDSVLGDIDDSENAYSVGRSKARLLKDCDYESFRRRLGDHLKRRGFGYGVIINTVERLWRERDK